jgi:hypothetical protein
VVCLADAQTSAQGTALKCHFLRSNNGNACGSKVATPNYSFLKEKDKKRSQI